MPNHVKVYLKYFGYTVADFIACEVCGNASVDIHHIDFRSKFGKKMKWLQDAIENLIALCRSCHDRAHAEPIFNKSLIEIHLNKMQNHVN